MGKARRVPVTAMLGASMFFTGITFASTAPYAAIVGIETLGLSSTHYAALTSFGAIFGALMAMVVGYISDRLPDRRALVLMCATAGLIGFGLIYLVRAPWAFVVSTAIIMPFGLGMFSQTFAYVRVYYNDRTPERSQFMVSAMRKVFTVAWVVVPPIAGYIAATYSVFDVYLVAALAYAGCGSVFAVMMTDKSTRIAAPPIAVKTVGEKRFDIPGTIIVGLAGIFVVNIAMRLFGLAMPLTIITRLGGTLTDVGIFSGIGAALEIPFMLMWGYLLRYVSREAIIASNALLYAIFIALVTNASSVTEVLWLQTINGVATAALMSIPISYMQDAIKGRVGLSTSIMDVTAIGSTLVGAAIFGALTLGGSYQPVLVAAAVIALVGGGTVFAGNLARIRRTVAETP